MYSKIHIQSILVASLINTCICTMTTWTGIFCLLVGSRVSMINHCFLKIPARFLQDSCKIPQDLTKSCNKKDLFLQLVLAKVFYWDEVETKIHKKEIPSSQQWKLSKIHNGSIPNNIHLVCSSSHTHIRTHIHVYTHIDTQIYTRAYTH